MKLFDRLFSREPALDPASMPPEFRAIAAKLPELPPYQRRAMQTLLTQAVSAGVTTLNGMDVFIETQPTHIALLWANTLMSLIK